jgi:hypothetical protein
MFEEGRELVRANTSASKGDATVRTVRIVLAFTAISKITCYLRNQADGRADDDA